MPARKEKVLTNYQRVIFEKYFRTFFGSAERFHPTFYCLPRINVIFAYYNSDIFVIDSGKYF